MTKNETTKAGERTQRGYALVNSRYEGFSWHPTFEDAQRRLEHESLQYGRLLRIVKDVEATWPETRVDSGHILEG